MLEIANGYAVLKPPQIAANCVCKLKSRFTRPFTWEVTVWGMQGAHRGVKRVYEVIGIHEQMAASVGMEMFSEEMALKGRH